MTLKKQYVRKEHCNKKYYEVLKAIHQWVSDDCPGS